ncbi:hypothetical protein GCM10023264_12800 [Sphingomonas daechungensis]
MARLVGDQLQEDKPKLAGLEHAPASASAAVATAKSIVVEFKVEGSPTARTAAHGDQALRQIDLEAASRVAPVMSVMSHIFPFDASEIYLSNIFDKIG